MRKSISFFLTLAVVLSLTTQSFAQKLAPTKPGSSIKAAGQSIRPTTETRFGTVAAYSDGNGAWLSWQMDVEVGNYGFQVYRMGKGNLEVVNEGVVRGAGRKSLSLPVSGASYEFFDRNGSADDVYYIQAWGLDGSRVTSAAMSPQWLSDIKTVAGSSSVELAARNEIAPQPLEKSVVVYTKEILREMEETQLTPDPVTHRTVISQPGVRLGIKTEGMYRVTRAQLQAAGFDVNSDPTNWQIYVEGVQQPMLIGDAGSYIEFYGKGIDTIESDTRTYYLTVGAVPGKRIASRVAPANQSTVVTPNYRQIFVKKDRRNYIEDIFNGEAENYWGASINSLGSEILSFNLSGIDYSIASTPINFSFIGYSNGAHTTQIILNNTVLGNATGVDLDNYSVTLSVPTSLLVEGNNVLKFKSLASTADSSFFDTLSIDFARKYVADQNKIWFYTQNYRNAKLSGFASSNVRVFDMTRDGDPVLITNLLVQADGPTFAANIPASRGRAFFAVEDSGLLSPDSITPNNPELLGDPVQQADLIIITYKGFATQAEAWAQYRRNQGFTAKVVEVSEICDEFNYGVTSSHAIKNFLQYAHDNWGNGLNPPDYVMLLGDASWDGRNYEGLGNWNLVPGMMVTTRYLETASDEALADFDSDGLAEIPIGRIPARTTAEVDIAFTKTVNWETALTPTSMTDRGSLFAYDFNSGFNFSGMSADLAAQLPGGTPSAFVFRGEANANTNLANQMNTGKFIVNYAGHGTAGSWGGNPTFFNVFSVDPLNPHNPGIYTMLTCLNGYYHWLYNPSMGEKLLFAPNKGAVVSWASSTLTTPDLQRDMALRFYLKLGQGTMPRIGDLVTDAKLAVPGSSDVRYSWVLLADPMLKVR